jgi:hypothetical protein
VNWIVVLVGGAMALGLSNRVLRGSTRMTLVVLVAVALLGLFVTQLR